MKFLTSELISKHLRLDNIDEEMELITSVYAPSAEESVLNILQRPLDSLIMEYGRVPTPVVHAALILTEHFYTNRSSVAYQQLSQVPFSVSTLLTPYLRL